jgi:hypothetical protein
MADTRQRLSADEQERASLEKNIKTIEHVEKSAGDALADEILDRYPLLVGKSEVELALLNKKVLRKLDWRFLPCITGRTSPTCLSTTLRVPDQLTQFSNAAHELLGQN